MAQNGGWKRRIERAVELGAQYAFAAEILRFYVAIARFQDSLYREIESSSAGDGGVAAEANPFAHALKRELIGKFRHFLLVVEQNGPAALAEATRKLRDGGEDLHFQLLAAFWNGPEAVGTPPGPNDFCARAFLQPYAVFIRSRSSRRASGPTPCLCPFCNRKPAAGVLRPLGDGGQRSLICSLCLNEWEFRRIVCPGCGEENHAKLPVYTAEQPKHVRVECCESCKTYIKTVDLTKNGLADPVVDEIASIPLDLWAREQGYSKLQANLMQF